MGNFAQTLARIAKTIRTIAFAVKYLAKFSDLLMEASQDFAEIAKTGNVPSPLPESTTEKGEK